MQHGSKIFFVTLMLVTCASRAAESAYPEFTVNGYGTLGAVHSSEDQGDFKNSFIQPAGAGYSNDPAFGLDTRVALQVTARISEKLSAVVQVISEQQYDSSYSPTVEWANIKYDFTPDFSLRAGRIVLPSFIVSDYRKVGFATHWVRPPLEVYGMVPVTNSDGVDAIYRMTRGEFTNTLQAFTGRKDIRTPFAGTWEAREVVGIFNTLETGNYLLRLGYTRSHINADSINSLMALFRQFGTQGALIADKYSVEDKPIDGWIVGGRYDPGQWFVMAEWARTESPSFLGTDMAWYVSGGYDFGKFTPYATFSKKNNLDSTGHPELDGTFLPPQLQGFAALLNAQLDNLLLPDASATLSAGIRWNIKDNFDVKLQLDHIVLDDNSAGAFANVQPGFTRGGDINVVSVAADFVF